MNKDPLGAMGATVTAVGPSSKKDKPRVVPF